MSGNNQAKSVKSYKTKNYYKSRNNQKFLETGVRGFLATCNYNDKDCIRDCYNILNEYADELYGSSKIDETIQKEETDENNLELDISEQLEKEIEESNNALDGIKKINMNRFLAIKTGTHNCVFIKTTIENPSELGVAIVKDLAHNKQQKTRFVLRLIPIECVCKANITDIINAAGKLFDKHFLAGNKKYSIIYNKRYNNSINRDLIIKELADLVSSKNITNKVDLKAPDYSIIVEIIKSFCLINVLPNYIKWKKYNLHELGKIDLVSVVEKTWE